MQMYLYHFICRDTYAAGANTIIITAFLAWAHLHRPPQLGLPVAEDTQVTNTGYDNCTGPQ